MDAHHLEAVRPQALQAGADTGEGLRLLHSLLRQLERQIEADGSSDAGSIHHGVSKPGERLEPLDKEAVVRRLIQRFRKES